MRQKSVSDHKLVSEPQIGFVKKISLQAYERQKELYTKQEIMKLKNTRQYKQMLKEKGKSEVNWNWQAWETKYGKVDNTSDEDKSVQDLDTKEDKHRKKRK